MTNHNYLTNKPILWLGLPLGFMAVQVLIEAALSSATLNVIHSENGPHELLQFVVMAIALCVAIATLMKARPDVSRPLKAWIALAALCCLYVAGEELSWGQQIINWSTPDYWTQVNDQAETNLHNTSSWLDQKPRLLLLVGVIVGGLIVPALNKFKPSLLPEKFKILYPEPQMWLLAFIALAVKITDKIASAMDYVAFERASEIEELCLFYFVLLYLLSMRDRLVHQKSNV